MDKRNCHIKENVLYCQQGKTMKPGGFTPPVQFGGNERPPDERKEGLPMYVTYADLFQFCIFICALVGLCYTIFRGKKK